MTTKRAGEPGLDVPWADPMETPEQRAQRGAELRCAVEAGLYHSDPMLIAMLLLFGPRALFGGQLSERRP